ncbi:hypothetical protein BY996DRAFT_6455266 [Phakopsora pachyrhizi]|uniref:Uncharacterized protein n=1 Tax=Phakopsora pachyrhizi TaxID=170000 RepID=A0AAV0AYX6_PHAPC|nr:hypothetical protein BY996DRAFT_6455266 [Phakopsora pachyrhizi]CAH7674930.1 hypothetical protein PPACK8108_LOCUS9871 [Phakopsora pachyrhizi]
MSCTPQPVTLVTTPSIYVNTRTNEMTRAGWGSAWLGWAGYWAGRAGRAGRRGENRIKS